jgi:molybdate transport system substrate-binding protein
MPRIGYVFLNISRFLVRALLLALLLPVPAMADDIGVFAAASLKTALDRIAADWQADTGNTVTLTYGGTPAMAKQIEQGAPADIFIAASVDWMDYVVDAGLMQAGTRRDILGNTLVVVGPPGAAPLDLGQGGDLAARLDGGKLSMALVESVPAGQYGKAALTALGLWDAVEAQVAQSENVRAALALVAAGEAPLGIVYDSDAVAEPRVSVVATFPAETHPPIVYPAALTAGADPAAAAFLDALSQPPATEVFVANGFIVP